MRLVFIGCSLLKWQFVIESLYRQLTFLIALFLIIIPHIDRTRLISIYIILPHMQDDAHQFYPFSDDHLDIVASVSNPVEKKSTISSFTVYTLKGQDKEGAFQVERRYSDFDHIRSAMVVRWPGCFVPPLPPKKVIGNTSNSFVEERCLGLNSFLKNLAQLKHLWYCNEFQTFLRGNGEMEKLIKNLPVEHNEDIIKKYNSVFLKLQGKGQDTATIGRVLEFQTYCKKILPVLENFKEMALGFIQAKNANNQQFSVLLNYVLPKYEESCLSVYCNKIVEGKFIFNETNDQKLAGFIEEFKAMVGEQQFEELYHNLELQARQIEAFLQIYKAKDHFETRLKDLKTKEKDLEVEIARLNAGKQGMFSKLVSKLEDSKTKANQGLQSTKDEIKVHSFMADLLVTLMGHFQIPRFRHQQLSTYFRTIKKIAKFQLQFTELRGKICEHVLDNHNLI